MNYDTRYNHSSTENYHRRVYNPFSFQRPIIFSMADIEVETLSGDALGHGKDVFGGDGANYYVQCYLPDMRAGESRISVKKSGVSVASVVVRYDTRKVVFLTWGAPFQEGNRVEIPVLLDVPLRILKKRIFGFCLQYLFNFMAPVTCIG